MNHDILINILKNGETYTINDGENPPYQVPRPPTKYTIAAADLIVKLLGQLQNDQVYLAQLQRERDEAYNELNFIKQKVNQNAEA